MSLFWPTKLLIPQQPMFHVAPMNVSGPVSGAGAADVIAGDAGYWTGSIGSVVVTTKDRISAWRAIAAQLRGRLFPFVVSLCRNDQPFPEGVRPGIVPHDDDTLFSDGTSYLSGAISVTTTTALARRDVRATVTVAAADTILPGHAFSFGERAYEVVSAEYLSETSIALEWQPPLRDAVPAGADLNFDDPVCRVRMASDREMQLSLEMNYRAFPSVNVVEDLL